MRFSTLLISAAVAASGVTGTSPAEQDRGAGPSDVIPGREADLQIARIAHRIAVSGSARCPVHVPTLGIVLQHLTQFRLADRAGMVAAYRLDRGPGVVAVVADSAAARAGLVAGDVLLTIDGTPVPPEPLVAAPFDQTRARARADAVLDLLQRPVPFQLTVLRGDGEHRLRVTPEVACPSRVHLARSEQRNAYADGRHVFITTALIANAAEDERAFMIAHEMAHNILGHAAVMRGPEVKRGLGRTLGHSGRVVRATERGADALGADLMLDAGYDPVQGAAVLRRLGGDLRIGLFDAHESTGDRIAAIRARVAARGGR